MYVFFSVAYRYVSSYCMTCRAVFRFLPGPARPARYGTIAHETRTSCTYNALKSQYMYTTVYTPTRMRVGCADVPDLCFPVFWKILKFWKTGKFPKICKFSKIAKTGKSGFSFKNWRFAKNLCGLPLIFWLWHGQQLQQGSARISGMFRNATKITTAWSAAGSAQDPPTQNDRHGKGDPRKQKPLSLSLFADYISGHDKTDNLPG